MRLQAWLDDNGISQIRFAKRIGVSQRLMHYWCTDRHRPKLEMMQVIEKETAGQVKPYDFLPAKRKKRA